MRIKLKGGFIIFVAFTLCLSATSWGRSMVTGKVVDAKTGDPIEGAAIYIYWEKSRLGPPGLGPKTEIVEIAEDQTDAAGKFTIPKYWTWFKHYVMAIYKKGYVCWSTRKIFPSLQERTDFKLKSGMVIKLERFREEYSKVKHARFTRISAMHRPMPGIFNTAIEAELDLLRESRRKYKKGKE